VIEDTYQLVIAPAARRQLAERLPEPIAFAAYEFIVGPLLENPQRVGKRRQPPLPDRHSARRGTYRVIYRIDERRRQVTVVAVTHRADPHPTPDIHGHRRFCEFGEPYAGVGPGLPKPRVSSARV
jgi:mRNA interferase RelE/StbE